MTFYDSVIQGYTTFVPFYDAYEAQTAEWSTVAKERDHDQQNDGTSVVRKK